MSAPDDDRALRLAVAADPAARARGEQVVARLSAEGHRARIVVAAPPQMDGDLAALALLTEGGAEAAVLGGESLPVTLPTDLVVAAVPGRLDPRDAVVSRDGAKLATLPRDRPVTVAASGAARRAQLQRHRRDLLLQDDPTSLGERLESVEHGHLDAVVVSVAELLLARPASTSLVVVPLEHGEVLHRPGQGTITVVCPRSAAAVRKQLARVDDDTARSELEAERELVRQLSQDDDPLVGAHGEVRLGATGQRRLVLLGLLTDATGSRSARASHETAPDEAVTLGRAMAATLLEAIAPAAPHGH